MEWMPIESAPDNREILVGYRPEGFDNWYYTFAQLDRHDRWISTDDGWVEPSVWFDLPTPPETNDG